MDYKFTLYLGLNDKDTKSQKIATVEAYKIVENLLKADFDGATIFEATGLYKHENGTFVTKSPYVLKYYLHRITRSGTLSATLKRCSTRNPLPLKSR